MSIEKDSQKKLFIRQLFESESGTYTYIVFDHSSQEAMIVDPVIETLERDLLILKELKLTLKYIAETHIHADHVTSGGVLKKRLGGQIIIGKGSELETADLLLADDEMLHLGDFLVRVILTPGHTSGCTSYLCGDSILTGDTLLIRGCGRTDFQGGSSEALFQSVRDKVFQLPDQTIVYPGHDYKGNTSSTVGEEKRFNPRLNLNKSKEDFIKIMSELKLSQPKKIDIAVPANLRSGL